MNWVGEEENVRACTVEQITEMAQSLRHQFERLYTDMQAKAQSPVFVSNLSAFL